MRRGPEQKRSTLQRNKQSRKSVALTGVKNLLLPKWRKKNSQTRVAKIRRELLSM